VKAIDTQLTNLVLGQPPDWNVEKYGKCVGLPVCDSDGMLFSWWRTTWKERLLILLGRPVRLCLVSRKHPPVSLDVTT
jgi:hypothetical protein